MHKLIWATSTALWCSRLRSGDEIYMRQPSGWLEGIGAKRKADSYGPETVWYKIKNRAYKQAEGRWELFQKRS